MKAFLTGCIVSIAVAAVAIVGYASFGLQSGAWDAPDGVRLTMPNDGAAEAGER